MEYKKGYNRKLIGELYDFKFDWCLSYETHKKSYNLKTRR